MDTNKMLEQFEAAFVEEQVRLCGEGFRSSALYMIEQDVVTVRMAWWAWQASREAVVVELPAMLPEEEEQVGEDWPVNEAYNNGIKGAMVTIKAQGLKVAP